MRTVIALVFLLCAPNLSFASKSIHGGDLKNGSQPSSQRVKFCIQLGAYYQLAASARDMNVSPKKTYETFSKNADLVANESKKEAVNAVYFNPGFTNAGGEILAAQIRDSCLGAHSDWKPIR